MGRLPQHERRGGREQPDAARAALDAPRSSSSHFGVTFAYTMEKRPDDVETAVRGSKSEDTRSLYVFRVVAGPDTGKLATFDPSTDARLHFGQGQLCEVRLTDPTVSRRHAVVVAEERNVRILDLQSTNGTSINGVRVTDAFIAGGALLQLGDTQVRVSRAGQASEPADRATSFGRILGASFEMRRLYAVARKLAAGSLALVVEGETGTGKELLTEEIHAASGRANGPFVVFDCAAGRREEAIFGMGARPGVFEEANGGTLVLDEVTELDVELQARLLRVIAQGELQRLDSSTRVRVDVRLLCTTRRDLDKEALAGRLRDDLLFRLAGARIEVPPLRRRHGDVELLTQHFWKEMGGEGDAPRALIARFADHDWPGNVRELKNAVARRVALGDDPDSGDPRVFARRDTPEQPPPNPFDAVLELDLPLTRARNLLVDEFERRYVARVVEKQGGNVSRAAAASGLALRYFQQLRARHAKG
jgi:DNA-binding NtrC family response regulator